MEEARPDTRFTLLGQVFDAPRPEPGLYLVATPIGNLGDMGLRALQIVAGADILACEDTRVTAKLLQRYGIRRASMAYHEHNSEGAGAAIIEALAAGNPDPVSDDATRVRCKLFGGSDLTAPTAAAIRRDGSHPLSPIEPRIPLRLRADGGPTGTMADIIAPRCVRDGNSISQVNAAGEDVSLQPESGRTPRPAGQADAACIPADQNRREFALAIADFGIAYTAALEPVNPEPLGDAGFRDNTALRFGRRHVAATPARPLAISSEDPGSQYFNYRHEPVALRISEATPDPRLGGVSYRQSTLRADLQSACLPGQTDCLGDMANAFSSRVHAGRDALLATTAQSVEVHGATRDLLRGTPYEAQLSQVVAAVEQWRRDFNCALYSRMLMPATDEGGACDPRIERREAWRLFGDPATPIFRAFDGERAQIRLIQGAQEAQHVFTMNGVRWRRMTDAAGTGFINAQPIGISEHFEADIAVQNVGTPSVDQLYFGSSVDQVWDGLWGIMRVTNPERTAGAATLRLRGATQQQGLVAAVADEVIRPALRAAGAQTLPPTIRALAGTPEAARIAAATTLPASLGRPASPDRNVAPLALPAPRLADDRERAVCTPEPGQPLAYRAFDVSAVRVCDLQGDCDAPQRSGIEYSQRFGIRDDRAIIYVLNEERRCDGTTPAAGCGSSAPLSNAQVLERLRRDFARKDRQIEPLVMRAPAGACLEVTLRNHLPAVMEDGVPPGEDGLAREVEERRAYHNFLPMITDGFNVNQFRSSASVGLSAPRLSQNMIAADGSMAGLSVAQVAEAAKALPTVFRKALERALGTLSRRERA